jgi:hypothetical protein
MVMLLDSAAAAFLADHGCRLLRAAFRHACASEQQWASEVLLLEPGSTNVTLAVTLAIIVPCENRTITTPCDVLLIETKSGLY